MERTKLIQQIYARLADLEQEFMQCDTCSPRWEEVQVEMNHLRLKLQDVMNSVCPIIKG